METVQCEAQPLGAAVTRLLAALEYLGQPLDDAATATIEGAIANTDEEAAVTAIQQALDPHCLAASAIDTDGRVGREGGGWGAGNPQNSKNH